MYRILCSLSAALTGSKVHVTTDLEESVFTHDISRSSVEEEVLTPLMPVVAISIQFDSVLHDGKTVVHLQLIHRQRFPFPLVLVRVAFFSSSCVLIGEIYQITEDLFRVVEVETLQRCD